MSFSVKGLVTLPIAASIATLCFSVNAHAQTPVNVSISPHRTLDQCNNTARKYQSFQIIICNGTDHVLNLVGVYNKFGQWPMGNVPGMTAQHVDFRPGGAGVFMYAANYAIGDTGRFFQVGISKPPAGREKINVCVEKSAGNGAAMQCFDAMSSDQFKSLNTQGETIQGEKQNKEGKTQWLFSLK